MQVYDPLAWLLQTFALFIAFTMQGAMWKGAQDHGGRGWFVALIWAVGATILLNAVHLLQDSLSRT